MKNTYVNMSTMGITGYKENAKQKVFNGQIDYIYCLELEF